MMNQLASNWWTVALRGIVAVLFGILIYLWPFLSLEVLVLLFGAYALIDGIFAIVAAIRAVGERGRWMMLLVEGIVGIAAGIMTFLWPGITAFVLLYLIAAWALITGILEIAAAIRLRREIANEWLLALGGIASVVFAILLVVWPAAGALAIAWLIGAYAILFGILLLALGFRLRGIGGAGGAAPA